MLGPELSARIAEFNRREKEVTPFMSLLAAFEVLLSSLQRSGRLHGWDAGGQPWRAWSLKG